MSHPGREKTNAHVVLSGLCGRRVTPETERLCLKFPRRIMQRHLVNPSPQGSSETCSAIPITNSVVARIAAQADAHFDRTALVDDTSRITFGDLEHRSDQLAAQLFAAGASPGTCVGLFLDRSVEFVIAALAVMKSGAAYLPLDPATPMDRALMILTDADARMLLTHRDKTRGWPVGVPAIDVDHPSSESGSFIPVDPDPETLAYIVYTSGSSGQPKGVEITHANLLNLIEWHQASFNVSASDRASQVAGLAFDAAAWEIWPHLTAGASLHIAEELTRRSPQTLRDWLVAEKITISFVPTVLAEPLVHAKWPSDTALRTLLTGADVLHRRPVAGLPFVVVNNYGPSECTVVATSGMVHTDGAAGDRPSIGAPIRNTTALILDADLRPVPLGEAGELCLAGALVGRGYRNRPELTASRFTTYVPQTGAPMRIFRTGDRVRQLPCGELAFLGRLDEQIKIRGYRIEPGEIVAWLNGYPGVEASAVSVAESTAGPTLIAYVVPASDSDLNASDLREFLAARLPDYMIPTSFVKMAALPMTANGKLDKAALPVPTVENLISGRPELAFSDEDAESVQAKIAALVASLLNFQSVAADANFFMIGGHSMLGVQLVARIRDLFGVNITLRQLFNAPTIAALSSEVEQRTGKRHD
jgi:amino acid adenylation domain-containing protein